MFPSDIPEPQSGTLDPALQDAIIQALARPPVVTVPADFAARVALRAVHQPPPRGFWAGLRNGQTYGGGVAPVVAAISGVLLLGALFAFAPGTRPSFLDLRFDLELTFLAELGGAGYLMVRAGIPR